MNDFNDMNESIGDGIASVAGGIDVGDADAMLTTVRGVATARRRRRSAVLGVAAAGTLAVSGVMLANVVSDNGSDDVFRSAESVPQSTEATDDADVAPPSTPQVVPEIVPGATGEPIPVQVVPANSTSTSDPAYVSNLSYGNAPQLLAWQDGFLAIRRDSQPQPLPAELPQEIIDQFPPEVVELFPDGLPATIDEAMAQLDEAGLLDEVTEIVTANADVFDAIYSVPTEVTVSVRFSTDGVEWSDVDASFPDEFSQSYSVYSTGDRLVFVSDGRELGFEGTPPIEGGEITVFSSPDLVNWSSQAVPIPAPPTDGPEFIRVDTFPEELIANADRWVLRISTYSDIDVISLLDEDLQDRVQGASGGYGTSTDPDGVTIDIYESMDNGPATTSVVVEGVETSVASENGDVPEMSTEPNQPTEQIRFTWSELGLDGPPEDLNEPSTVTWTSNWVDAPVVVADPAAGEPGWYRTAAIDGGFVTAAENGVLFSADGLSWSTIDLPVEGFIDGLIPLDNGVVAFVNGSDGTMSSYQLDVSTMSWTTIAIEGLPDHFSVDRSVRGAATLYENDFGDFGAGPTTSVGTIEVDGFRVELTTTFSFDSGESTYTVTDIATGEVVSTESSPDVMSDENPFEFAEESYEIAGEEGITFLDPATGDQLVQVPFSEMTFVQLDADGQPMEEPDFAEAESSIPSRWMLATDGSSWIVEQLSEASSADTQEDAFDAEIGDIAVNNGTVLIAKFDGTFLRYDLD